MLQVFQFEQKEVRFVGTADKPEWIAQDVCDILGIEEARQSLRSFKASQKGVFTIHTPGGSQEVLTVTEPGLYRLIFKSRKPVAEQFQDWVFEDVLPSIRKTGEYKQTPKIDPYSMIEQLSVAEAILIDSGITPIVAKQLKLDSAAKQLPAAKDMFEQSKKLIGASQPLESVGLTPTEIGDRLEPPVNAKVVNSALETLGLQEKGTRQSTKTGKDKHFWQLTEKGKEYGHVYLTTGNNWSGGQIRWQDSVVLLIQEHLAQS